MRFPAPTKVPGAVAIFADAHLGQAEKDGEDFLAALEALYERGFRTVVLLGDIFHYFIGSRKFETPLLRQVLDGMAALAARGVSFRYIEGNRDFFLDGSRSRCRCGHSLTDRLELGGRRYAFVHGDRVNTSDLPYRFFRVLSKTPSRGPC
jgi:UDP-2,3-diacylglucosamine pyrophosphatase LpxH